MVLVNRIYECRNADCPDFAIPVHVKGRPLGSLWEFPNVVCGCGLEPMIVPPMTVDGAALRLALTQS